MKQITYDGREWVYYKEDGRLKRKNKETGIIHHYDTKNDCWRLPKSIDEIVKDAFG